MLIQVPQALVEIASSAPGATEVLSLDAPAPKADMTCPMMSLPLLLGRRPDTPGATRYLQASHQLGRALAGP